jgi:hypothetical protein
MHNRRILLAMLWWLAAGSLGAYAMGIPQIQHMSNEEFLQQAFSGDKPQWKMLIMNAALKQQAADILQHPYNGMRVRYWIARQRTAWIIDEIGKEMPITIGVVIEGDSIEQVKILVFREERGGEVYQDFFTRQFERVSLAADGRLSRPIDGITGATLSVEAVTRVANLVLVLHRQVLAKASLPTDN